MAICRKNADECREFELVTTQHPYGKLFVNKA